jgi:hypothetical protein
MTVVASSIYLGGKRGEDLPLGEQPFEQKDGEFAWIGVTDPTADEMNKLKAMFGLHSLAVEDALNGRQVPKVDVYGEQLFVVAKTAHLEGDKIAYGETCIFVGTHHVISVRHGSARAHKELREQLEQLLPRESYVATNGGDHAFASLPIRSAMHEPAATAAGFLLPVCGAKAEPSIRRAVIASSSAHRLQDLACAKRNTRPSANRLQVRVEQE